MSNHNHVPVIREWGHKLVDGQVLEYPALYGCTKCNITSVEVFKSVDDVFVDHTTCGGATKCFGCKAKSLQLNAGDAKGSIISGGVTQKQDDAEQDGPDGIGGGDGGVLATNLDGSLPLLEV